MFLSIHISQNNVKTKEYIEVTMKKAEDRRMIEKYNVRTDLALEQKERFDSDHVEVQGVVLEE